MRISDIAESTDYLGQPTPEASAVSAIIKNVLGQPYPKIKVEAIVSQTGTQVASGETDSQGRVRLDVPSSGLPITIVPKPGFLYRAVPEEASVVSRPISGLNPLATWGWGDSINFVVYPKKAEDFISMNTLMVAGLVGLGVWYFFLRDE